MEGISVKVAESQQEMEEAMTIRFRVFVEEQGVPPEEERDEADARAVHVLALHDGRPVGTGRLVRLSAHKGKIGRMAVDRAYRRDGVGGMVLVRLEEEARRMGLEGIVLHAQTYIKRFYARHGYVEEGEPFMEAGIEHIVMRKGLGGGAAEGGG